MAHGIAAASRRRWLSDCYASTNHRNTNSGCPRPRIDSPIAGELIESIIPNEYGWFFPSAKDPSKPVSAGTLYSFMWRQRDRGVIPVVTNRDLRRTWKTLAGKAGVSKEIRDRIQNHTLQDVSSKSYDRWSYMGLEIHRVAVDPAARHIAISVRPARPSRCSRSPTR
jgi:hypothetical protein